MDQFATVAKEMDMLGRGNERKIYWKPFMIVRRQIEPECKGEKSFEYYINLALDKGYKILGDVTFSIDEQGKAEALCCIIKK